MAVDRWCSQETREQRRTHIETRDKLRIMILQSGLSGRAIAKACNLKPTAVAKITALSETGLPSTFSMEQIARKIIELKGSST